MTLEAFSGTSEGGGFEGSHEFEKNHNRNGNGKERKAIINTHAMGPLTSFSLSLLFVSHAFRLFGTCDIFVGCTVPCDGIFHLSIIFILLIFF